MPSVVVLPLAHPTVQRAHAVDTREGQLNAMIGLVLSPCGHDNVMNNETVEVGILGECRTLKLTVSRVVPNCCMRAYAPKKRSHMEQDERIAPIVRLEMGQVSSLSALPPNRNHRDPRAHARGTQRISSLACSAPFYCWIQALTHGAPAGLERQRAKR